MFKLLIVDDSKLNRIVLKELARECQSKNPLHEFDIYEAENGVEAVDMAQRIQPDIILMDIMMPEMDGIEATRIIKQEKKISSMIIAVSSLEDDERKREILCKGAEDYIQKPVNADIFIKRMEHYLTIIGGRCDNKISVEAVNLFDNRIYSRKLIFVVLDERTLGEFWDYYLAVEDKGSADLPDLVRLLWGLGIWQLKLGYKFYITVEDNADNFYFTMNNMKLLDAKIVQNVIQKNYPNGLYALDGDKLSILCAKESAVVQQKVSENSIAAAPEGPKIVPHKEELQIFNFLEKEDLLELEDVAAELGTTMLMVGSSTLEDADVAAIAHHLNGVSKILSSYSESYAVSQAFKELSMDISSNMQSFRDKSHDIALLCVAFNNDLKLWVAKLFYEGAPSVDFMDKSIISNANMISGFIKPQDAAPESLDDIFDF